jgi:glycine betaine catabolism B
MAIDDRSAASVWSPDIDTDLVCVDVHEETHDVKTFTFVSREGKQFAFSAGQYFAFDMTIDGEAETRCYSISSSPMRRNAISFTVKRVAGGKASNWLHDTMMPGISIRATGPIGSFVRPQKGAGKYLLVSGGSGITPLMSMAREMADEGRPVDTVFLHAGRSPLDLVFRADLAAIATRLKGFRQFLLPESLAGEPSWPGVAGRVSRPLLEIVVPDLAERIVMCCGPAPFMAAIKRTVTELGVSADCYFEESFDAVAMDTAPENVPNSTTDTVYAVEFSKQKRTIDVSSQQTVLSAAKKGGIRLPSSCSTGLCGTCKSKLLSGSVDMQHNGGIRQREIDAGLFLPCCSRPLSNLVVER